MEEVRRVLGISHGARRVIGISGSLVAASGLVLPWVPLARATGTSNPISHHGIPGATHIEFHSGIQILAFALGGPLPGTPQVTPPIVVNDYVYPVPWLILFPFVMPLITLAIFFAMPAMRSRHLVMSLYWAVAILGLIATALNALIVFAATSLAFQYTPALTFAAVCAYAGMGAAYTAILLGKPGARLATDLRSGARSIAT
jgi:hypothetical protein